jgi:hypothetical protein
LNTVLRQVSHQTGVMCLVTWCPANAAPGKPCSWALQISEFCGIL